MRKLLLACLLYTSNSEFLLIADALGAYMVQNMEGTTESEQLANLTEDSFFSDICESLYKHFIFISECSKIAVYDEWNIWVDKLLDIYSRNQYSQLQRLLQDEVPSYNDGVIGLSLIHILYVCNRSSFEFANCVDNG